MTARALNVFTPIIQADLGLFRILLRALAGLALGASLLVVEESSAVPLVNGNFEDGLNGWEVHGSGGIYYKFEGEVVFADYPYDPLLTNPFFYNAPGTRILTENIPFDHSIGKALFLHSRQYNSPEFDFLDPAGKMWNFDPEGYEIGIHQSVYLRYDQELYGWAGFATEDYAPYDADQATVRIEGELIWEQSVLDVWDIDAYVNGSGLLRNEDLQRWSWRAPKEGVYLLSLSIYGDDQEDAYGYFDRVSVPANDHGPLFLSALLALASLKLIVRKRKSA